MKNTPLPLIVLLCSLALPLQAAELNRNSTLRDMFDGPSVEEASPAFAKVIDDLPLMPGLRLIEDNDLLFAEPDAGRIAETTAEGEVDIDDMYQFYRRSLPQLGWKNLDSRSYQRGTEILRIDAHAEDKATRVRFSVRPAGQ